MTCSPRTSTRGRWRPPFGRPNWSSSTVPATWPCWTSPTPSTTGWSGWSTGPFRAGWPCGTGDSGNGSGAVAEGQQSGMATCERVEDTVALGSRLGEQLRAGDVVVLSGPLGAGKTVLAKGIAAAMIHVDVYRLLDHGGPDLLGELDSLDLDTDLDDSVVVVEWGEGLAERLSERHLDVRLERVSHSDVRIATWRWVCSRGRP